MTESTTKAKASKTAESSKTRSPNGYLATLPEGWHYEVTVVGPDGASVRVTPHLDGPAYSAQFRTPDGSVRQAVEDDLKAALATAAKSIKALDAVAREEAKVRAAREEAMKMLGTETSPEATEPEAEYPIPDPKIASA